MSLRYRHGFFPFPIYNDSLVVNPNGVSVTGVGLSDLSKIFWLSKSADVAISLAYSFQSGGPGIVDTGTVAGSGTVLIENLYSYLRATGALPGERVLGAPFRTPLGASPGFPGPGLQTTVAGFDESDSSSYSYTSPYGLTWFAQQDQGSGVNPTLITKSGAGYITRLVANGPIGNNAFGPPNAVFVPSGTSAVAANLVLKLNGVTILTTPFGYGLSEFPNGLLMTGAMTIDFNSFWTP